MKIKVNRLLSAGKYHVNFEVSDFTPEEISKMASFGIPQVDLRSATQVGQQVMRVPLTQINKNYNAVFALERMAKEYEEAVLTKIRTEMDRLRASKDEFSSSDEVNF